MEEFLLFFMSVFVLFISINKINKNNKIKNVRSTIDNIFYPVRKLPDAREAANKLAIINRKVLQLINILDRDKDGVHRLIKNYNPNTLSETIEGAKYTSYSLNKGEKISICIRHENNSFIDENTVMFVVIHELSHVMTKEIGHPPIFWRNMKYLLEEAEKLNIYRPVNYVKYPENYCGMIINTTPYDFK